LKIFEQQTLCHNLSKSFDFINAYNNQEQWVHKRNKIIQEFKRPMFNIELGQYEIEIQRYEHLYEEELTTFESETSKINSLYQMPRLDMFMHFVKTYPYHHKKTHDTSNSL